MWSSSQKEKKTWGQQREEVAWSGPPGKSHPSPPLPAWSPLRSATTQSNSCVLRVLESGHWGCVRHTRVTLSKPFLQDSVLGLETERWKVSALGDRVPPTLLARKWGAGPSCLLSTSWCWAMGTSRWVEAQRREGTMLETHSMSPRPLQARGKLCVSQLSNRFDWSPRVRSIQDAVGSWTPRVACRVGSYRTGPDPCPTWDTEAQAKVLVFCTPHPGHKTPVTSQG